MMIMEESSSSPKMDEWVRRQHRLFRRRLKMSESLEFQDDKSGFFKSESESIDYYNSPLTDERIRTLMSMGFIFDIDYPAAVYKITNNSIEQRESISPQSSIPSKPISKSLLKEIQIHNQLLINSKKRISQYERLWCQMYSQYRSFILRSKTHDNHEDYNNDDVLENENNDPENWIPSSSALGYWILEQRRQYDILQSSSLKKLSLLQSSTLTHGRINALQAIGFNFTTPPLGTSTSTTTTNTATTTSSSSSSPSPSTTTSTTTLPITPWKDISKTTTFPIRFKNQILLELCDYYKKNLHCNVNVSLENNEQINNTILLYVFVRRLRWEYKHRKRLGLLLFHDNMDDDYDDIDSGGDDDPKNNFVSSTSTSTSQSDTDTSSSCFLNDPLIVDFLNQLDFDYNGKTSTTNPTITNPTTTKKKSTTTSALEDEYEWWENYHNLLRSLSSTSTTTTTTRNDDDDACSNCCCCW